MQELVDRSSHVFFDAGHEVIRSERVKIDIGEAFLESPTIGLFLVGIIQFQHLVMAAIYTQGWNITSEPGIRVAGNQILPGNPGRVSDLDQGMARNGPRSGAPSIQDRSGKNESAWRVRKSAASLRTSDYIPAFTAPCGISKTDHVSTAILVPHSGKKYVAVAGNIGAGKSSLTRILSSYFKWEAFFERVDDNPYLSDFYEDMHRWSFNLQVFFLSSRFEHQRAIEEAPHSVVQDRSIYEDAEIFARNLHEMGLMSARDYENYQDLFGVMTSYLRPPDLLVYLRAGVPTLVNHIQSRGREFESTIRIEYLQRLNKHYEDWVNRYDLGPKLIIDVDEMDFVNNEVDQSEIVTRVESRLYGLFPE